jgi:SAM-dependent methyltransferase
VRAGRLLRRVARRVVPRRLVELARGAVPVNWRYRGAFARAYLRGSGVAPWTRWARLTPLQRCYVEFALTTNERGRWAVDIIERFRPIRGARTLDIGCAYGGFLVAFAARGAREVVGIDVEPRLLDLARLNLREHRVAGTLARLNIEDTAAVATLGRFDVIVINDVLEHVLDLPQAIVNTCGLLAPGGILFAVVPNKYYVRYLVSDGHYQLPGLTLLSRRDAEEYFGHAMAGSAPYSVGYYRTLPYYERRLTGAGLQVTLFEGGLGIYDLDRLCVEFDSMRRLFATLDDPRIPPRLVPKLRRRAGIVDAAFRALVRRRDSHRAEADELAARIIARFGMEAWYLIGRRPAQGGPP